MLITVGHQQVGSVQAYGDPANWPADAVYVGMPGNAARAYGITDESNPGFGKPWYCLNDPRGWETAYREYLHRRLIDDDAFRSAVLALHGKTLLCWCLAKAMRHPNFEVGAFHCHAVILAKAVEWLTHAVDMEVS